MRSPELLQEALAVAKRLGYTVRPEWLGSGGGVCYVRGSRCLFVDLAQSVQEQLAMVLDVLRQDPNLADVVLSPALRQLLNKRRAS